MPDGTPDTPAQEATTTQAPEASGSRSIDSFPPEAQDYIRRLRDEAAQRRNNEKELSQRLKEFEDANKTEQQKLEERAAQAEKGLSATQLELQRYKVAAKKGIPLHLADRLRGTTQEELEADADKLKEDFGLAESESSNSGRPGFDGGVRRPVNRPKTMNDLIRQKAGMI